ncbi:DUF5985 family protein [Sandaracinus amylolyticus]|uniref:Uncharacterized protein n=1 Tax=Sandaracinus amylolyticus TaxID=927083 RepID=A0A0F6SES3_9BACT|nr:DUF5985 family protein [Sandaracinus amylolyticus]AKF05694.1 hypothetical protein DB32_002843 [Sandaracinus amylolyticus]
MTSIVPVVVYLLCAATSLTCAVLLVRGYRGSRSRLLLWSSICFVSLALNNILLFVDFLLGPNYDLSLWRTVIAAIGMAILVYGLIWEPR